MDLPSKEVKETPIELLGADPMNIREATKIDTEFRDSIEKGIIEPLIVRPVDSIEQKKAREELRSRGIQFVVTAGVRRLDAAQQAHLKTVPCIARELKDLEALALSIAENKHRKDIPPARWTEIVRDLYGRLEGPKEQRVREMHSMTGMGESTIKEYLLLDEHLTEDFRARLKEPKERSFSETQALAERSLATSEKKAPIDESGEEKVPPEPPRIPERVMVKLIQDKDFRQLMKKDPAKAHEIATQAAVLGQDRVGEVLRTIRERPKRKKEPRPPVAPPVEIAVDVGFSWKMLDALERYREEHKHPDLPAAACSILLDWFKRQTHVDYVDLQAALEGIIVNFLQNKGYTSRGEVKA